MRYFQVDFGVEVVEATHQRSTALHIQAILEVEVNLTGVSQANPGTGLWGINHACVGAVTPGAVPVFVLAVTPLCQSERRLIDGGFALQHPVHGFESDADGPLIVEAIGDTGYQ
ncbi:hypothetical protein D3C79_784610 [compost metagenome]